MGSTSPFKRNPFRFTSDDRIGTGATGCVWAPSLIWKGARSAEGLQQIQKEFDVYKRIGQHRGVPEYIALVNGHLVLARAKYGSVRDFRRDYPKQALAVPFSQRLTWVKDIVSTVVLMHSKNIIHCDLSCSNVFIDMWTNAKLGDFAGSSIDGGPAEHWYEASHTLRCFETPSHASDIFALGSTIYEMLVGEKPFAGLPDAEIEMRLDRAQFPDVAALPACKQVVWDCWNQRHKSATQLLADVETQVKQYNDSLLASTTSQEPPQAAVQYPGATDLLPSTPWLVCIMVLLLWIIRELQHSGLV